MFVLLLVFRLGGGGGVLGGGGGGGGAFPHNWVSGLGGVPTRVCTGRLGRDGIGLASMIVSYNPCPPSPSCLRPPWPTPHAPGQST